MGYIRQYNPWSDAAQMTAGLGNSLQTLMLRIPEIKAQQQRLMMAQAKDEAIVPLQMAELAAQAGQHQAAAGKLHTEDSQLQRVGELATQGGDAVWQKQPVPLPQDLFAPGASEQYGQAQGQNNLMSALVQAAILQGKGNGLLAQHNVPAGNISTDVFGKQVVANSPVLGANQSYLPPGALEAITGLLSAGAGGQVASPQGDVLLNNPNMRGAGGGELPASWLNAVNNALFDMQNAGQTNAPAFSAAQQAREALLQRIPALAGMTNAPGATQAAPVTAVNPRTGERRQLVNGQWIPIQ